MTSPASAAPSNSRAPPTTCATITDRRRPGRHGARAGRLHHAVGRPIVAADRRLLRRPAAGARLRAQRLWPARSHARHDQDNLGGNVYWTTSAELQAPMPLIPQMCIEDAPCSPTSAACGPPAHRACRRSRAVAVAADRQFARGALVGRRQPDLGLDVRADARRLRLSRSQGSPTTSPSACNSVPARGGSGVDRSRARPPSTTSSSAGDVAGLVAGEEDRRQATSQASPPHPDRTCGRGRATPLDVAPRKPAQGPARLDHRRLHQPGRMAFTRFRWRAYSTPPSG